MQVLISRPVGPVSPIFLGVHCAVCGRPAIAKQIKTVICAKPGETPYQRTEVENFCEAHDDCDLRVYGQMGLATAQA